MDELKELYQQVILDHNKDPKNYGKIPCNHSAEGYNPLCGDIVKVYAEVENGIIKDIHFEGSGCAISKASASLMTEALKGKTVEEAEQLFAEFKKAITAEKEQPVDMKKLGKLAVLAGVREFPSRVKCAGLAWHAANAAIHGREEVVSTE